MWPMLLDYSKDESKRILRRLELGAYASIVSVFRAQGDLSKDKKKILQDLQQALSISTERHRAEVRRAINDEKLTTIADSVVGNISTSEWMVEGRRLVPLMPRLVPQTNFTATANQAATLMVEKNVSLPPPSHTCNKNDGSAVAKLTRPLSPTSSVGVLPKFIDIKGMLDKEEEEDLGVAPQRCSARSLSTESQNASNVSTQTPRVSYSTATSSLPSSSPVKITISKSPQGRPANASSGSQPPKVILVTSASGTQGAPVLQRSTSVPVVRSVPAGASTHTATGLLRNPVGPPDVVRSVSSVGTASFPGVVTSTVVTCSVSIPVTVSSTSSSSGMPSNLFNPSVQIGLGKVRPRIVPRQRYPGVVPGHKSGVVLPMGGPQLISPSTHGPGQITVGPQAASSHQPSPGPPQVVHHHTTTGGIQVKTLNKPTIQIKQEGGMKIITQSASNKILPKPSQMPGTGSSSPVVMVNTGQSTSSTTSTVTMLPRTISTYTAHSGGKVLNITTPGGRVIATTTKASNVVTVNPKTLHLTAVKSGSGSTTVSKPNVIVVQKTQHPRLQSPMVHGSAHIRSVSTSSFPGAIDKEVIAGASRHVVTANAPGQSQATAATLGRPGERRVIITTSGAGGETTKPVSIIHRSRSDSEGKTSCLLTELIQAARQLPPDQPTESKGPSIYEIDNKSDNFMSAAVLTSLASLSSASSSSSASLTTYPSSSTVRPSSPVTHSAPLQQPQLQHHRPPLLQQPIQLPPPSQLKLVEEGRGDIIGTARSSRLKSENDSDGEVISVEQAMSLLNREIVDLTDIDATAVIPSFETITTTSTPTINIANTPIASHVTTVIAGPVQPKVSILGVTQKASGKVFASLPMDKPKDKVKPASPVDLLREGHLDTQTGIFYPVIPSPASSTYTLSTSSASSSSSSVTPFAPCSVKIIDIAEEKLELPTSLSSLSVSTSSLPFSHRPVPITELNPYSPPLQVVQQLSQPSSFISPSPPPTITLPKVSNILPSSLSSILTSSSSSSSSLSSSAASLSSSTTVTASKSLIKSTAAPHIDIISSSLAHAGLNLDTFVHDNEGSDFDSSLTLTLEDGRDEEDDIEEEIEEEEEEEEEEVEEIEEAVEKNDGVDDQIESALSSSSTSSGTSNTPRPGMAEVIREETAKDGTRILTVSNPASSQLDNTSPLAFLNGQQQMVSLPSHTARQSQSPHLGGITVSTTSSRIESTYSTSASVEPSRTEKIELVSLSPSGITVHHPGKNTVIPNATAADSLSVIPDPSFLPLAVPVDKSPRVITLRLDDLATTHKLDISTSQKQNSFLEEEVIHPSVEDTSVKNSVELSDLTTEIEEEATNVDNYSNSHGDSTTIKPVNDASPPSIIAPVPSTLTPDATAAATTTTMTVLTARPVAGTDQTSPVRSSKRKRKHPSDGDSNAVAAGGSGWVKLASTLLMKVCQFKGSPRDRTDIPAAEWFTFPVDPLDAPDYYTVVQNPIDFSTMKRKLKDGQYTSFDDFEADMNLIRSNCNLYNSEGTKVRQDCEEVMSFYRSELNKMLDKQTKDNAVGVVNTSPLKRTRVEEKGSNS